MPPASLPTLFRECFPILRAKCARLLGDTEEAADVAQEAFVRLCSSEVANEEPLARLKWLYQTSTRLAIDHLRRRRLGVELPEGTRPEAPDARTGAEAVVAARDLIARLVREMDPGELEVVVLARVDEMTHEEIAQMTALSSRTIRRILDRAEKQIERFARSVG